MKGIGGGLTICGGITGGLSFGDGGITGGLSFDVGGGAAAFALASALSFASCCAMCTSFDAGGLNDIL